MSEIENKENQGRVKPLGLGDIWEFESVVKDENGDWLDQDNGDKFEGDELFDAVFNSVASGFYDKFEYEWKKFLKEFNDWFEGFEGE